MNTMWIRRNKKRDVCERMENKPADRNGNEQDQVWLHKPHKIRRGMNSRTRSGAP